MEIKVKLQKQKNQWNKMSKGETPQTNQPKRLTQTIKVRDEKDNSQEENADSHYSIIWTYTFQKTGSRTRNENIFQKLLVYKN